MTPCEAGLSSRAYAMTPSKPERRNLGERTIAEKGADAPAPTRRGDGPANLDLAQTIDDAVLGEAPPDTVVVLPSEIPAEAVGHAMGDLLGHHVLALLERERAAGSKPGGHVRVPEQAVNGRTVRREQFADLHNADRTQSTIR